MKAARHIVRAGRHRGDMAMELTTSDAFIAAILTAQGPSDQRRSVRGALRHASARQRELRESRQRARRAIRLVAAQRGQPSQGYARTGRELQRRDFAAGGPEIGSVRAIVVAICLQGNGVFQIRAIKSPLLNAGEIEIGISWNAGRGDGPGAVVLISRPRNRAQRPALEPGWPRGRKQS
jgi:hypothetical protein